MKLASWNVNGIRACIKKGFFDWVIKESPDVISLQETKASVEVLKDVLSPLENYKTIHATAIKKGYSGVSLLVKNEINLIQGFNDFEIEKFDCEGRFTMAEFENFYLIGAYFPNGSRDHSRVPYKLEFSYAVMELALSLPKPVLICGDVNTAHHEIDLKNPKTNRDTTGFLEIERKYLDELEKHQFIDVFRHFHPDEKDHYSWWSYRSNCRERNIGWRIDYFLAQTELINSLKNCYYQPHVLGSDHCPIICQIDFDDEKRIS